MLSLLGSLLGFGTSFLPKVMDFFQDKQDKKHELAVLDKQMEAAKKGHDAKLEEINADADIREIEALHRHDTATGVSFIDGLRGSVRPVITYAFFFLFCFVEWSAYAALTAAGVDTMTSLETVWDEDVKALFAAVISFWFGGRAISKYRGRG